MDLLQALSPEHDLILTGRCSPFQDDRLEMALDGIDRHSFHADAVHPEGSASECTDRGVGDRGITDELIHGFRPRFEGDGIATIERSVPRPAVEMRRLREMTHADAYREGSKQNHDADDGSD